MTESEWLSAVNPYWMIRQVLDQLSTRQARLFSVARCLRIWDRLTDVCREAVRVAECYADGLAGDAELETASAALTDSLRDFGVTVEERNEYAHLIATCRSTVFPTVSLATGGNAKLEIAGLWHAFIARPTAHDAPTLRDIFGNPFRPVTLDPRWQTETVVALATGIYAERAFDRMPILADALEEAGCDLADILAHCRGDGPHVRGCWVVDLVLGKE